MILTDAEADAFVHVFMHLPWTATKRIQEIILDALIAEWRQEQPMPHVSMHKVLAWLTSHKEQSDG